LGKSGMSRIRFLISSVFMRQTGASVPDDAR